MKEKLAELESQRLDVRKKANIFFITGALLALGGFALFFVIVYIAMIFVVIGIILIINGSMVIGKFSKQYKENIVTVLVKEEFGEDAIYQPKGTISQADVLYPEFLQKPDVFSGEDYVKAVYKNVIFEMCDLHLQEEVMTTDARGNVSVSYQTYFRGSFFIFDFNRDLDKTLYIMPGRGKPKRKSLIAFETESMMFNKKFNTYASKTEDGFYLLTPKMIEKIMELKEMFKGRQFYAFLDGKLYIAIDNHRDTLEINLRQKLDETLLEKTRNELRVAPAIINEFGLDKSKFTVDKE